jgi:hypothetical protein
MNTVQPVILKFTWNSLSPTWEGMPFWAHAILMYCYGTFHVDINVLPPFKPNQNLLEVHKDKGTEDWEIFAWAVRDVMSKFGNMKLSTQLNSEKIMYKDFMVGKTDTLTYAGKVFTEKPMRQKSAKNNSNKKTD